MKLTRLKESIETVTELPQQESKLLVVDVKIYLKKVVNVLLWWIEFVNV